MKKINSTSLSCQIVYLLVALVFVVLPAPGLALDSKNEYDLAVSRLFNLSQGREDHLLYPGRNHKFYLHGKKQKCVVLQLHGLFQSPLDQRGFSEYVFKLGCNVVSPLLAGHWEKNESAFYEISYQTWQQQILELADLSLNLGENLILAGHSTGGLLAFNLAQRHSEKVKALVLFSPALKLTPKTHLLTWLGTLFDLSRQGQTDVDHEYDAYKKPAQAGDLVRQLNRSIFGARGENREVLYQEFKTPTLIFSTEDDDVVSHQTVLEFQQANPKMVSLVSYARGSGVFHDNIQRGLLDVVPTAPSSWINPFYESLLLESENFLQPFLNP